MFALFKKYPKIVAAVSTKNDGTMKLTGNLLRDKKIKENRNRFLEKFGIKGSLALSAELIHGNNVRIVSKSDAGSVMKKTDGLITAHKSLFLTITVADCLPIFIYDPEKEIVGLIHAGWRGLSKNILLAVIKKITENFRSLPEDILVGVGPGISQCHFEVKDGLLKIFKDYLPDVLFRNINTSPLCGEDTSAERTRPQEYLAPLGRGSSLRKKGKNFLDLKKIAKIQLINLGIKEKNIEVSPECTFCLSNKYFSFRRDKELQTMIAIIGQR